MNFYEDLARDITKIRDNNTGIFVEFTLGDHFKIIGYVYKDGRYVRYTTICQSTSHEYEYAMLDYRQKAKKDPSFCEEIYMQCLL